MLLRRSHILGSHGSRWQQPRTGSRSMLCVLTRFEARHCRRLALQQSCFAACMQWHVTVGAVPLKCLGTQAHSNCSALHKQSKLQDQCRASLPPQPSVDTQELHRPASASQLA